MYETNLANGLLLHKAQRFTIQIENLIAAKIKHEAFKITAVK